MMYARMLLMKDEWPPLMFQTARQSRCGRRDSSTPHTCRSWGFSPCKRPCSAAAGAVRSRVSASVRAAGADAEMHPQVVAPRYLQQQQQPRHGLALVREHHPLPVRLRVLPRRLHASLKDAQGRAVGEVDAAVAHVIAEGPEVGP